MHFIKLIYFLGLDFFCLKSRNDNSWGWKSIQKGKDLLRKCIRWNVGMSENISIWKDPWIPQAQNVCISLSGPVPNDALTLVSNLIDRDNLKWDLTTISNFVSVEDRRSISKIPLSRSQIRDEVIWHFYKKGAFSIKFTCYLATSSSFTPSSDRA